MYKVVTMTPDMAEEYLKHNVNNRNLSSKTVDFYAKQMLSGGWILNGETVKIAKDGTLIDGQHRLSAVVKANIPVEIEIIDQLPLECVPTIDTGKARTASDVLSMNGFKYTIATAGAVKMIMACKAGKYSRTKGFDIKLSNNEILDFVNRNRDIVFSAKLTSHKGLRKIAPSTFVVGFHYLFSKIDEDAANHFFNDLESGAGLKQFDPVLVLRNRLLESALADKKEKILSRGDIFFMIIKAWNARRNNDLVKRIAFGLNEKFPTII